MPPLVVDDDDIPSLINDESDDEEAYVGPRKMKAAADGTSLANHRLLIITMTTNTKEQLSKGRKDDTSAIPSSLQQGLKDNSINTSLIATQLS